MAVERRNPLPIGHYWVDVPASRVEAFDAWVTRSPVIVRETRTVEAEGAGEEGFTSYLFEAREGTPWEGPGFPTIADEGTRLDDTVERPDPEPEVLDQLKGTAGAVKFGVGVALIGFGFWAVSKLRR